MPRWHFLRFFVSPSFVCLFFFLGRMLAFFVLSLSDETTTPSRERKLRETWRRRENSLLLLRTGDSVSFFLPGRRTVNRCIHDTKERERERERLEMCPSCPLVACLSFGRHFRCPYFFRFLGGRRKKHRRKFCSFLVSQSFSRFCFLCCTKISCACSTHEHNTKRRDEIRTQRVVVRK